MQEQEHLHCANKLTRHHINFENQKMKVHLATQLFSRSVAKSLEFCREHLKLKGTIHCFIFTFLYAAVSQLQFVIFIQNQTKVNFNYNSECFFKNSRVHKQHKSLYKQ